MITKKEELEELEEDAIDDLYYECIAGLTQYFSKILEDVFWDLIQGEDNVTERVT